VIVPLRPDIKVDTDRKAKGPSDTAANAAKERRGGPEQLSLFDEPLDR
jgi:hypothetical protein